MRARLVDRRARHPRAKTLHGLERLTSKPFATVSMALVPAYYRSMRPSFIVLPLALGCCHAREEHSPDAWSAQRPTSTVAASDALVAEPNDPAPTPGGYYAPEPDGKPTAILRTDAPNMHYASLDRASCETELRKRAVPFVAGEATQGVLAPERIRGALHGVDIHSALAPAARDKSSSTIFDCRLVLGMDDFAALAAKADIVEMDYFGAYRPQSANGCTPKYAGKQHCGGLAVDIATFKRRDGTVLSVEKDFHGHIGDSTCGPTAQPPGTTPATTQLWRLVCDTAEQAIFNVMLTPNYNAQHFNHFHVEITPDAEWMLIH